MSHFLRQSFQVLHNPTAGRRKQGRLRDIVQRLRDNGAQVDVVATSGPGHATDLALHAAQSGSVDCIVAAGGDGTISEAATGLLQARERGMPYEKLPSLGILPMGTANVMAQDLGLVSLGGIARRKTTKMLLTGPPRPLHLGIVANDIERRAFVMMVGAGFDGAVVADIDLGFKKRFGKLAYVRSGLLALLRGCKQSIVVSSENAEETAPSQWVIITNGQHYAGGHLLTRRTSLFRMGLASAALKGNGRLHLLKANLALGLQRFDTPSVATTWTGTDFTLSCLADEGLAEVDGDYFSRLPITVGLAKDAIPFLRP